MGGILNIFNLVLINPIFNLLLLFLFIFASAQLPGALGWAIVALTVFFRFLFNPMYKKQMEMAAQMEEIRPKLEKLQKKYKDDPKKLQKEQLKIYQEKGINPASGCLLGLVQFPIIIALYQVLLQIFENGSLENLGSMAADLAYFDFLKVSGVDPWFLGFNLGVAPSQFGEYGQYYLIVPLITAGLQYFQVVFTQPEKKDDEDKKSEKKSDKDEKKDEGFQAVFQKQMKIMFPLMIGYFAYILPVGLALYWNVFSIFSILQGHRRRKAAAKAKQDK